MRSAIYGNNSTVTNLVTRRAPSDACGLPVNWTTGANNPPPSATYPSSPFEQSRSPRLQCPGRVLKHLRSVDVLPPGIANINRAHLPVGSHQPDTVGQAAISIALGAREIIKDLDRTDE